VRNATKTLFCLKQLLMQTDLIKTKLKTQLQMTKKKNK